MEADVNAAPNATRTLRCRKRDIRGPELLRGLLGGERMRQRDDWSDRRDGYPEVAVERGHRPIVPYAGAGGALTHAAQQVRRHLCDSPATDEAGGAAWC